MNEVRVAVNSTAVWFAFVRAGSLDAAMIRYAVSSTTTDEYHPRY